MHTAFQRNAIFRVTDAHPISEAADDTEVGSDGDDSYYEDWQWTLPFKVGEQTYKLRVSLSDTDIWLDGPPRPPPTSWPTASPTEPRIQQSLEDLEEVD